jgi:hypothetical protein
MTAVFVLLGAAFIIENSGLGHLIDEAVARLFNGSAGR